MRRPSVSRQVCYWVLILALFAVRAADAHTHFCLDGLEPRAALHVADGGIHHSGERDPQSHTDQDVKVVGDGALKQGESADLWIPPTAWSVVDYLSVFAAEPPQPAAVASTPSIQFNLRPPLRGPPR